MREMSSQQDLQNHHFDGSSAANDDFLEQMLSTLGPPPAWHDLSKPPWDPPTPKPHDDETTPSPNFPAFDDSFNLASKFRSHQISPNGSGPKSASAMMLQHQLMLARSQNDVGDGSSFKSPGSDGPVQALFNAFGSGSLPSPNQFHHPQSQQSFGAPATTMTQTPAPSGSSGGAQTAQARPRVRARRGQATDPHSIAERLRRERIAERMKALQELVPNANKTDKASMLDEIIDYVKFLQLQVKVLSMSRLGGAGAGAVAPLVADMSSEGGGDCVQTKRTGNNQTASSNETMTVTEHQVAKLMEEDMGSAMQYLQGKGLCLMPISLATAISTATCHSRNPLISSHPHPLIAGAATDGPTSPSLSVLTVQSATAGNGAVDASVKDNVSVSKP